MTNEDLMREKEQWKHIALYMIDCHAANTEGSTPNRLSKYDKRRFLAILKSAVEFIKDIPSDNPGSPISELSGRVRERCEEDIIRMMNLVR